MESDQERSGLVGALAAAGVVGPVVFVLAVVTQGWIRPGYSHVTMPVSALGAGASGWIQNVNFMLLGLLLIAQSVGVHLGVRSRRRGTAGPVLLALSGLAIVGAGVFPAIDARGNFSPDQAIHSGVSVLAFITAGLGMIALSRRVNSDPGWDGWSGYVLSFGIGVLLLLLVFGALARPPGSLLHDWMGIVQRGLIGVWLSGIVVISLRLRRVIRDRRAF